MLTHRDTEQGTGASGEDEVGNSELENFGVEAQQSPRFSELELWNHEAGRDRNLTCGTKRGSVCQGKVCGEGSQAMPAHNSSLVEKEWETPRSQPVP